MSLFQRISSIFQPQRPASCHLHLLNKGQPLQTSQTLDTVEVIESRPLGEPSLDLTFLESISDLGGKENILLVGEAGFNLENSDRNRRILGELSFALFGTPLKCLEVHERPSTSQSSATRKHLSKTRMLDYPVILLFFRDTLLMDVARKTLVKEVLSDVQVRTKESKSAMVGIVLTQEPCQEEINTGPKEKLDQLMSQVFKRQPWGVCCYFSLQPQSIQEVKWTIIKTLGEKHEGENIYSEYQNNDPASLFQDLVHRLGGKERFLLLGNICPSASTPEKVGVFEELIHALFDDTEDTCALNSQQSALAFEGKTMSSKECVQYPETRSFPHPLILVVFRSSFLMEDCNKAQVKEILIDIKMRVKASTQVVGVLCSQEPLGEHKQRELQNQLQKSLCHVFNCSPAVCTFVRTKPETVDQVKKCVCGILRKTT
ncbi:uncharacterized protein [Pyxicephalus adspersus]|uniref:uncharacterized protein n=1 Tax=Pyxicephalus adspersus TaxID=30357 RepID=UPI003B596FAD